MTRKDVIIISVLANIGVLAIIFMLAFRGEESKEGDLPEIDYVISETSIETKPEAEIATLIQAEPIDEGDLLLTDLSQTAVSEPFSTDEEEEFHVDEPQSPPPPQHDDNYVEVTIKRGDALEKIARANGTTVDAIKKANHLKNDRLNIGQVLKVPVGNVKKPVEQVKHITSSDVQYYVIKSGDNPWKIAKQFHIKVDELLKLNNLNEEKARNLKVGDQIRVK